MDTSEINSQQSDEKVLQSSEIKIVPTLQSYNYSDKCDLFPEIYVVSIDIL